MIQKQHTFSNENTAQSILKQANLSMSEFRDLL